MGKIRAAAYCRVSTAREEQEGSYEMQAACYRDLIQSSDDMELVGIYGDRGRSGLHKDGRPGLQKLMEDCRAGKIQRIYTKSISRFARNMAECAEMIRELRKLKVNIIFEKENLYLDNIQSSLVLNILSAIAQEESHSISQHSIKAHEQYALQGRPYGRISFGYRSAGNHCWVICEEEARKVRCAFRMAEEGKCYQEIIQELNRMEEDGYTWNQQRLKRMLMNVVYKGDYFTNASVCIVPGKQVRNKGFRDRIYITGHHEPIVSPELFDDVQEIIGRGILVTRSRRTGEIKGSPEAEPDLQPVNRRD